MRKMSFQTRRDATKACSCCPVQSMYGIYVPAFFVDLYGISRR